MPWYSPSTWRRASKPPEEPTRALTAAAAQVKGPGSQFLRNTERWQNEVWGYYDSLGEFNYGVWWLSNMLSRVRLRAARLNPDADEPEILTKGPAAELLMRLGGGVSGQAQLMKRLTVQLSLPGEGYLIGETRSGAESWQVRSVDEIRAQSGGYYVMDEESVTTGQDWRALSDDSLVVRVWRPHDRYYHLADSPARSAREIMRELELVNRHICAQYLSRLASAGLFAVPDEITFPVREEFADAPNPFMAEWIEIAAESIQHPGSASSVIPIPMMGPAEALKELRHIDFTLKIDEKIIEKRDSAIKRLATKLDMPAEVLLGMGDVNHWGAWQLDESALKTHISPVAELIVDSFTRGYLQPRLAASGEKNPEDFVVWYDMSELALRPDRSANALQAYDRMELSAMAMRRELGFDEDDKPTNEELKEQALKVIIHTLPSGAASALAQLIGEDVQPVVPVTATDPATADAISKGEEPPPVENPPPSAPRQEERGVPRTRDTPPPPPGEEGKGTEARTERALRQARVQHVIRFTAGRRWELLHPDVCDGHAYGCPFSQAVTVAAPSVRPGTSGAYLCHLNAFGLLEIDGQAPYLDTSKMVNTSLLPRSNGRARV